MLCLFEMAGESWNLE